MKRIFFTAFFAAAACATQAQSAALADMQQDFALIKREVGQLRLEVEQLRLENERLSAALKKSLSSGASAEGMNAMATTLRSEMAAKDESAKREVLAQVRREMESMASQVNSNLGKLASAVGSRPQQASVPSFSNNYPQNGVTHTVVSGDTLSGIARKYGSRVKWIQDANRIADPSRGLMVGQTIFVPKE